MHPARDLVIPFSRRAPDKEKWRSVSVRGDCRLIGKQAGGAHDNGDQRGARSPKDRKHDKSNVVGRALRTVYDETLREEIPHDFLSLLGKLD